ncbi:MAG TPA: DNA polymerase III subunit gamma/tau [Afifellaceae bacterium]|nr:DNA polymerase III subunit gamma/tau [Afifellaceae bacterium]
MSDSGYQVLARKYRPDRFDDLIGQEPMVRTLRNAFAAGRIAHAWMLTGVRGVGKTTTARILARGLNFAKESEGRGEGVPTVDLPAEGGVHCKAIMEGRHPDVIEMDAASHTGIDDIREIIDSARYAPVSARYKVYIIDEVHMLSKAAFNGLLKTLEEPPEHVKFIFATTEIRRVPVTVLSRCQRFDLRRIEPDVLVAHLKDIAGKEGITAGDDALALIARAAEGSVRDALSIFDQAIAHGGGTVESETVRGMLGLADRARIIDLFEHVMRGDIAAALGEWQAQYETGADPHVVLADLAEFTHLVTRLKLAPEIAGRAAIAPEERERGQQFAEGLSLRVLSRCWQLLLKGLDEVAQAPRPSIAADMVLVRLCHAADLPTPDEAMKMLQEGGAPAQSGAAAAPAASAPSPAPSPAPVASAAPATPDIDPGPQPYEAPPIEAYEDAPPPKMDHREEADAGDGSPPINSFEELIEFAKARRDRLAVFALERHVKPVRCEWMRLEIALTDDADPELPQILAEKLREWTGERWVVALHGEAATPSIHQARLDRRAELIEDARAEPLVAGILDAFPGAAIVEVRERPEDETEDEMEDDGGAPAGDTERVTRSREN